MQSERTSKLQNLKPHNLPHNLKPFNLIPTMSIFSKIAAGEIPSYKCAESEDFYAFLDINPVGKAHTLVIPRKETDYLFDIEDEEYAALLLFAKRVAKAIKKAFPCKKVGMAVLGLEVAHAHIHLIPRHSEGDMDFRREKLQLSPEEMQEIAAKIQAAFE
jgi:histidine triad (HIT) family protein